MNTKRARLILLRYHKDGQVHRESERALVFADTHEELKPMLNCQTAFDERVHLTVGGIEIPATMREKFEGIATAWDSRRQAHHFSFRNPAILSVFVAFLVLAFLGMWLYLNRSQSYPGAEEVEEILQVGKNAQEQYEAVVTNVGSLGDWLAMKGFDGYYVPPGLGNLETGSTQVFTHKGQQVAGVVVPREKYLLLVFPATPFGIQIEPAGAWKVIKSEEGEFGAQVTDGICFVIAPQNPDSDLAAILSSLPRDPQ